MKRKIKFLCFISVLFSQVNIFVFSDPVTVNGVSSDFLDSYYEGVARVFESAGNLEYLDSNSRLNTPEMSEFLFTNSIWPVVVLATLSEPDFEAYKAGAMVAANTYSIGAMKACIPLSAVINRAVIQEAINEKFTGQFPAENLGILVIGALDSLRDQYPCR